MKFSSRRKSFVGQERNQESPPKKFSAPGIMLGTAACAPRKIFLQAASLFGGPAVSALQGAWEGGYLYVDA